MTRGKFIVFEGLDGSGKSTQVGMLVGRVRTLDKYQEVLLTREPTWRARGIKRALEVDDNPYSGAIALAQQYIEDRSVHWHSVINPALLQRIQVLGDRYSLSTCAFQSTQGLIVEDLLKEHQNRQIGTPDLTFYVDVPVEVAQERIARRKGDKEKFEKDRGFNQKLRDNYLRIIDETKRGGLAREILGQIEVINGAEPIGQVEAEIWVKYSQRIRDSNISNL